ncbi:phytoene desaturase, partial [Flavobacterium sp. HMWF030]
MKKTIAIIGSGFSALAAACYLAQQGNDVTIYEKNESIGGRARQFKKDGFTFDMGPSWYWMPDVFERFFQDFNKKTADYYDLIKLNPAYRVYFGVDNFINIYDNLEEIKSTFENIEKGSGNQLETFINQAKSNYDIAIKDLVYRPGVSPLELVTAETILKLNQFLSNVSHDIRKKFKNEKLIQILEFPVLFLGAKPTKTPSFYNFMNYADFGLGTWHPKTGMFDVVRGIENLALELGVTIKTNASITKIVVEDKIATGIIIDGNIIKADIVLSGADYHHTETLLDEKDRAYSEKYWQSRVFAPSSLLFFVGFNKKIENITHHALFFDVDFNQHAADIYDNPKWPDAPLF